MKKQFDNISGWLILDKPLGITSANAVAQVKRLLRVKKLGHAGTLDPMAAGLLPLGVGEATKIISFVTEGRKLYRFSVQWGVETNTDDMNGKVTVTSDHIPTSDDVKMVLPEFIGAIEQIPPNFSAIKVSGERAYAIARRGGEVVLPCRTVSVHWLKLEEIVDPTAFVFSCECSKGTYIRALVRDLGRRLGSCAHITSLRRLTVGCFNVNHMITLEELECSYTEGGGIRGTRAFLRPTVDAIANTMPEIRVDRLAADKLMCGQSTDLTYSSIVNEQSTYEVRSTAYATYNGALLAIVTLEGKTLRPNRVFLSENRQGI